MPSFEGKLTGIGLTGNQLKIIAMLAMLADHVGLYLFPSWELLRVIGRLAFPIFAYMIAEGCFYTRNRHRYFASIALLGILCQIVATVVVKTWYQGILLTFSLSILSIYCLDTLRKGKRSWVRIAAIFGLLAVVFFAVVLPLLIPETGFRFDYDALGVLLPVLLYHLKGRTAKLICTAAVLLDIAFLSGYRSLFALLALPLLFLYNGKRGASRLKYLFYIFYPAHLLLIHLISLLF